MALCKNYDCKIKYCVGENITSFKNLFSLSDTIVKEFTIDNAYVKIINTSGDKSNVSINVGIYTGEDNDILVKTEQYFFKPDLDSNSPNFIKQGYEYLKTLPKFADAVDVLEDGQML